MNSDYNKSEIMLTRVFRAGKIPIILHELGHVIRLFHEQSWADRDDYVIVHQDKIIADNWHNFNKRSNGTYLHYNKPYDFHSIMHYGKSYFAKIKGDITTQPKLEAYLDVIGKAKILSFYDVQIVNSMYRCAENCKIQTCPGRGFRDKNCECVCPGAPNTTLIKCQAVTCKPPPLSDDVVYTPMTSSYLFMESVRIQRCKGKLWFQGDQRLTCTPDGTWNGTAKCTPYCQDGTEQLVEMQNSDLILHTIINITVESYQECLAYCRNYERILCRAFAYGFDQGMRRCQNTYVVPSRNTEIMGARQFWSVLIRKCY